MCILCALVSVNVNAQFNSAPAFPGAEGYGRYTTGGRGGVIRHVTNLNDSGTGSFRAAVNGSTKKIVVFDVAGVIELASDLEIGANTTILGQTAPGDGITLRYYTVKYASGGNIIMRYMRIRRGQEKDVNDGADATWTKGRSNIILDHCSFSWSIDEVASFYDNKDFTMQWCTIGEPLKYSGHEKGPHGYGGIWGGKGASFHHNLLIHLDNRAPRLDGARFFWKGPNGTEYPDVESCIAAEKVDLRNCVIYNTGTGNGAYGGMGGNHNIVNNYYKAGPATKNTKRVFQCSVSNTSDGTGTKDANFPGGIWGKFYISGNYVTAAGSSAANYDWSGVTIDACKDNNVTTPTKDQLKISEVEKGSITTHSAEVAYERVLSYAGASKVKDCIDTRYEREVRNNDPECIGSATSYKDDKGTHSLSSSDHPKGIIDVTADALAPHGGVYTLDGSTKATDSDGDGIPDEWEDEHDLNKNDASDALTYTLDKKGYYQNIEVYANNLVEAITKAERAGATDSFEEYYPLDSDDPAPMQTVITASPASVDITGTASATVTLSSNNASGAYSITTQPNASFATASISGNTITITGVAAGSTSLTVTQDASTGYTSATKEISITVTAAQGGESEDFHAITIPEETILLTKANIEDKNYLSASTNNWSTSKTYGEVTGLFYNMSSTDRTLTIKVSNCSKVKFTVQNSTNGRTYSYSINGGEDKTITHEGTGAETTSEITVPSGNVTIVLKGGGSSVYPISITAYKGTTPTTYTVSASATYGSVVIKNGSTTVASGTAVEDGTSLTFTATPADGYKFTQWNDGNTDNPRTVVVNGANVSLTAEFEEEAGETTLFSMTSTATGNVIVNSGQDQDLSEYATITGGSALIHNGHSSKNATMISASGFSCLNSGSSYIKITLDKSLKEGDILTTIGGDGGLVSLSESNSDSDNISGNKFTFTSDYNGNNVIYVNRGHSKPTISSITITRGSNGGDTPGQTSTDPEVTGLSIDMTSVSIPVGTAALVKANVTATNNSKTGVNVNAADGNIVKTYSTGAIIGVKPGTTTVTFTSAYGGLTKTCEVTVTAPGTTGYTKNGNWYIVDKDSKQGLINAIGQINLDSSSDNKYIFLPNGIYDLGAMGMTTIMTKKVSIIGESEEGVIIKSKLTNGTDGTSYEGLGSATTLLNRGSDLYLQDITIQNAMNYYNGGGRAACLQDEGTSTVAKRVKLLSYQDTYYSHKEGAKYYWEDSEIHGTVDFMCGSSSVFYNRCLLYAESRESTAGRGQCTLTAPAGNNTDKGYCFYDCTIDANCESFDLGRAWKNGANSVYINTTFKSTKIVADWFTLKGMSENVVAGTFSTYGSKKSDGSSFAPNSSSKTFSDSKGGNSVTKNIVMSASEAANYTLDKFFTDWQPDQVAAQKTMTTPSASGKTISWSAVSEAAGYLIEKDGEFVGITTTTSYTVDEDGTYTVRAANARGGFGEGVEVFVGSVPRTVFELDFEETSDNNYGFTVAAGSVETMAQVLRNDGTHMFHIYQGNNNDRTVNLALGNESVTNYKLEFDLGITSGNSNASTLTFNGKNGVLFTVNFTGSAETATVKKADGTELGTISTTKYNNPNTISSSALPSTLHHFIIEGSESGITLAVTGSITETKISDTYNQVTNISNLLGRYHTHIVYDNIKITTIDPVFSEDEDYTSFTEGTYTVKLKKTFPPGTWTSLVLPFSATTAQLMEAFPNNAANTEVAVVKEMRDNRVYFVTQAHIDANSPVLIKVGDVSNDNTYTFTNVTVKNSAAPNTVMTSGIQMKGIYKRTTYLEEPLFRDRQHLYFIYGGRFYDWSYLSHMSPFSAYIYTEANNAVAGAKPLIFMIDGEATGISDVKTGDTDGAEYNSVGQRISKSAKGIHIKNGKKYFVK